jgi:hypothetical protein
MKRIDNNRRKSSDELASAALLSPTPANLVENELQGSLKE